MSHTSDIRAVLALLGLLLTISPSFGQQPGTDGDVDALVIDASGRLWVGGNFDNVGDLFFPDGVNFPAPNLARWNPGSLAWEAIPGGEPLPNTHPVAGLFRAGGFDDFIFVTGNFTDVPGSGGTPISSNRIAAYNIDTDEWSAVGGGVIGIVFAVHEQSPGTVMLGGKFEQFEDFSGDDLGNVAIWDGGAILPFQFLPMASLPGLPDLSQVTSIEQFGSDMVVGTNDPFYFYTALDDEGEVCGVTVEGLLISDDVFGQALGPDACGHCQFFDMMPQDGSRETDAILEAFGELYVGGTFSEFRFDGAACEPSAVQANSIIHRKTDGTWEALTDADTGVNGIGPPPPFSVSVDPRKVHAIVRLPNSFTRFAISGNFVEAGGKVVNGVAIWDAATERFEPLIDSDTSVAGVGGGFGFGVGNAVRALAASDDGERLYVGGNFFKAGDKIARNVAYYDFETNTWNALGQQPFVDLFVTDNNFEDIGKGVAAPPAQTLEKLEDGIDFFSVKIHNTTPSTVFANLKASASSILAPLDLEVDIIGDGGPEPVDIEELTTTGVIVPLAPNETKVLGLTINTVVASPTVQLSIEQVASNVFGDTLSLTILSDCNGNGVPDHDDIADSLLALDENGDGVIDSCETVLPEFDLDGDGVIDSVVQADASPFAAGAGVPLQAAHDFAGVAGPDGLFAAAVLVTTADNGDGTTSGALFVGEDGSFFFDEPFILDGTPVGAPAAADFDGDGVADVAQVVTDESEFKLAIHRSKGTVEQFALNIPDDPSPDKASLEVKELTGDDNPDVVLTINNSILVNLDNAGLDEPSGDWLGLTEGTPLSPEPDEVTFAQETIVSSTLEEVLAAAGQRTEGPAQPAPDLVIVTNLRDLLWINDGAGAFTFDPRVLNDRSDTPITADDDHRSEHVVYGDLNGDGLADRAELKRETITDQNGTVLSEHDFLEIEVTAGPGQSLLDVTSRRFTVRIPEMYDLLADDVEGAELLIADVVLLDGESGFPEIIWQAVVNGELRFAVITNLGTVEEFFPIGFRNSSGVQTPDDIARGGDGSVRQRLMTIDVTGDGVPDLVVSDPLNGVITTFPTIADVEQCPADITDSAGGSPDGAVNVFDLLELLANWGTNGPGANIADPPNDIVDVFDLLALLAAWGDC